MNNRTISVTIGAGIAGLIGYWAIARAEKVVERKQNPVIAQLDKLHRCASQTKALSEASDSESIMKLVGLIPDCSGSAIWALGRRGPAASQALPSLRESFEKRKVEMKRRLIDLPYSAENLALERISGCKDGTPSGGELLFDVMARSHRFPFKGTQGVDSSMRSPFAAVITNEKDWRDIWR